MAPILTDLGANPLNPKCNLKQVSYVVPDARWSDHSGGGQSQNLGLGPDWVGNIVNAVGNDPNNCGYWNNTIILITWDDWGGWYDHVPPFSATGYIGSGNGNGQQYVYGFRVPLLVVSPYTLPVVDGPQSNFTCTGTTYCHDFGSILLFIEDNFGLSPGGIGDPHYPYADYFAPDFSSPLGDFINTDTAQSAPNITVQHDPSFFINYSGQPMDPDNDADE